VSRIASSSQNVKPRVVLYIHRLALANPTGVHRYAIETACALHRGGGSEYSIELASGRVRNVEAPAVGVPLTHPWAPRRPLHLAWLVARRPAIERVIGRLDLLHMVLPLYPIRSRAPQVLTVHDLMPLHHPEWYDRFARIAFRRAIEFNVPRAAAIITPSEFVAADVERSLHVDRRRIRVIPEGVDDAWRQPIDDDAAQQTLATVGVDRGRFLVTVGAVSPRKNLRVVFEALAHLEQRGDAALPLVVVGGDEFGAEATRMEAQHSGVAHLIRFAGRLDDVQLRNLLGRATALVHPSRYEGFGLPPLEAMAAGTPVIASDTTAIPEVVGAGGLLVDPDDARGWATAISSVVGDPAIRNRLIAAGRTRSAQLTWERAAGDTLEVYRRVLSAR
jgi:glycosyltransferase involved in cell wall biosynthesis